MSQIVFSTFKNFMQILESDFNQLKDAVTFPYDFEPNFQVVEKLINPDILAQTTYGKKLGDDLLPPYIEFSNQYFGYKDNDRPVILLHEIIHAYQRQDVLFDYNQNLMEILKKFDIIIAQKREAEKSKDPQHPDEKEVTVLDLKFKSIKYLFDIPFEIWDDLYFKEKYEKMYEQNMALNFNNVSGYIPQIQKFEKITKKYWTFKELLRTKYLSEINSNLLHENFVKLNQQWIQEFQKLPTDEKAKLEELIEPLTDFKNYPNPSNLTNSYEDFLKSVWNNLEN